MIMRIRENGHLEFLYHCFGCGKQHSLEINGKYKDAIDQWRNGTLIQRTQLGELSNSTREILISQICPKCQEIAFANRKE